MCKTILQKVKFRAPPLFIYTLLTSAHEHKALTGKPASIDLEVGGRFSTYGGTFNGVIVNLAPGKRIVQAWRRKNFPDGIFSMVTLNLTPTPQGGTELKLTHRGVPKELIPEIEHQWRSLYWDKIREICAQRIIK